MKIRLLLFLLSQIFYIAKAESSFGLKLGNSINKSRISTVGDSLYDNFFSLPYAEVFLNLNGHRASVSFGYGNHRLKRNIDESWLNAKGNRVKFQLSYQNTKILNKFLLPSGLKSLMSLTPTFDMYVINALDYADQFNFDIGFSAYYLKFGNYEPYISFSLPVTKPVQSWSFHAGLNINIPISGKNETFEDF